MTWTAFSRTSIGVAALTGLLAFSSAGQARDYLKGERPQQRGYSEAVITEGGKTIWLAGQTATVDDAGRSLAGDFDGQVRQLFKNLDRTLQKAGGKLGDMVQMTVFITDVRNGDRLTQIRREVFGDNFPGSALITITALAVPDAKNPRLRGGRRQIGLEQGRRVASLPATQFRKAADNLRTGRQPTAPCCRSRPDCQHVGPAKLFQKLTPVWRMSDDIYP
jgi:2-iminobutanoate/2-iminopropanoate deaminase